MWCGRCFSMGGWLVSFTFEEPHFGGRFAQSQFRIGCHVDWDVVRVACGGRNEGAHLSGREGHDHGMTTGLQGFMLLWWSRIRLQRCVRVTGGTSGGAVCSGYIME
jgi:hypothetical protein